MTLVLSVINSQDAVSRPIKKLYTQRDWSTNLYNLDIECSHPRKFGIFSNKVDFINKVDDIERANPKILYYPFKKEEYNLTNKDIEKSYPSAVHFKTKRVTNPLQPKYKFFEGEDYPPEVPRFIRDSIDIKDIPGACPKKRIFTMRPESMNDKLKSIDGAQSHIPYFRKSVGNSKYDYLNYSVSPVFSLAVSFQRKPGPCSSSELQGLFYVQKRFGRITFNRKETAMRNKSPPAHGTNLPNYRTYQTYQHLKGEPLCLPMN